MITQLISFLRAQIQITRRYKTLSILLADKGHNGGSKGYPSRHASQLHI